MAEPLETLQNTFSEVIECVMSMSAEVIKKSGQHLHKVASMDPFTVEKVKEEIFTLFGKINTNLEAFRQSCETGLETYKNSIQVKVKEEPQPPKKFNLSLRKDGQSSNIDLTLSDSDDGEKPQQTQHNGADKSKQTESDTSDTESEKKVPKLDVKAIEHDGNESDDSLIRALNKLQDIPTENTFVNCQRKEDNLESMSFDFDDLEPEEAEMKLEVKPEETEIKTTIKVEDTTQGQEDNEELLGLLNEALGADDYEQTDHIDEAQSALQILLGEISSDSDFESNDSFEKEEKEDDLEKILDEEDSKEDYETESVEEPEVELKEYTVSTPRIDQLDDAQIDRICKKALVDSKKCLKTLKKFKKRRKRIKVLSTLSSSSSDISLSASTISNLLVAREEFLIPEHNTQCDATALADEFVNKLGNDEIELSSDSEEEETPKKKRKKEAVIKKESDEDKNKSDSEEIFKSPKKKGSWRTNVAWSSESSDDDAFEPEEVLYDPEQEERENSNENETTVISDSENSDDDVTFLDDIPSADSSFGKGRKKIRSILSDDELSELTQKAKTEEDERIQRIEEHSKTIETIQSQREDFVLDFDVKSGDPLIVVDHNLSKMLKPHQKEGIKFMWEACYESVEILKTNPGTGCILAHCMGLGKTRQVITLIHTLFTHPVTNTKHVLVICPLSTVINWRNEFRSVLKHVPEPDAIKRYFIISGNISQKSAKVRGWHKTGGVLMMGYDSFRILSDDNLSSKMSQVECELTHKALLSPGPDLIVCDEGHQLKNGRTKKNKAAMKVDTRRRIILTGTPLQNNLEEYYHMVEFVKPHLLGNHKEYRNRFATPISNGQFHDSTPQDIQLMKKRTHVLTKLLKKTVHRVENSVLSSYLPELTDYTIFLKLTPLQVELYTTYINMVQSQWRSVADRKFFNDVMLLNFNNLHPYTLQLYYSKPKSKKKQKKIDDAAMPNDNEQEEVVVNNHIKEDWYKHLLPEDVSTNINYSSKLKLLLSMVDCAIQNDEKLLIFARYLVELDVLEHFLKLFKNWRPGQDYYRMDGETAVENRDALCKCFNTNADAKVLLLTHRVGGLGLNLTGANRVIMIGSNHNPTLDTQSMYRVYRFGQEKKCYIYRLLSLGTMEEKIYHRCVVKLHLAGTVVDMHHYARNFRSTDLQEMYNIDFAQYENDRPIPAVPTDKLLAVQLQNIPEIYKYYLHNSLLENRPEEELTDEDKKLAWEEFNRMDEAAKQVVAQSVPDNRLHMAPTPNNYPFPYHPYRYSLNRFQMLNAPRPIQNNLVPNPMNDNARGFLPRPMVPPNVFTTRAVAGNHVTRSLNVPAPMPQNSNLYDRLNPTQKRILANFEKYKSGNSSTNSANARVNRSLSKDVIVVNERPNTAQQQVSRAQSNDVILVGEIPPSGEFNYALNKVV